MKAFFAWLDNRTGYRKILAEALYEKVPGGARWRYVWGSTLTFTLFVQIVTGLFLWMAYNPSSQTAWESVYYIQHEMTLGWLLRGIHHFTAQAMIVLLVLHLMQVVIDGAYKAPREVNFWFGIALLLLTLGLSLTGYLLPWDQKGFYATKVTVNIIGSTPLVGPALQRILVGGADYGHHTLSRFFALHAGFIPGLLLLLLVGHIYLFRKHGLTAKHPKKKPDTTFWPDQVLMDAVACLAVMAAVLFLVLRNWPAGSPGELGAELGPPVDLSETYGAARPEWYFLFLFQLLKYFPGKSTIIAEMILPALVLGIVALMPFLGRWRLGHRFNIGFLFAVLSGAALLTWLAVRADQQDPEYRFALEDSRRKAARVKALASGPGGIPQTGAATLLQNDPLTQGPVLFSKHCASCHRYGGHDGTGRAVQDPASAPDLKDFASRDWILGLLDPDRVHTPAYFGGTKHKRMIRYVQKEMKFTPEDVAAIASALAAEAKFPAAGAPAPEETVRIARGRELLASGKCAECHRFHQPKWEPEGTAGPDLTGYGSEEWLRDFTHNPEEPRFYGGRNDRMPLFGANALLSRREIDLIVRWLRKDYPVPGSEAGVSRPAAPAR